MRKVRSLTEAQRHLDAGRKHLIFGEGPYRGELTVTRSGVTLEGRGTVLAPSERNQVLVTFRNVDFVGMRDFFLDGDWKRTTGVRLEGVRWSNFANLVGDQFHQPLLDLRADLGANRNVTMNTFSHIHAKNCVRLIRLQGSDNLTRYVTLNEFQSVSGVGIRNTPSTLVEFVRGADNNVFPGIVRFDLNHPASVGVVFNSGSPDEPQDVYENHFTGALVIDQQVSGTHSVIVNDTRFHGDAGLDDELISRVALRIGGSHPTPPIVGSNAHVKWTGTYRGIA